MQQLKLYLIYFLISIFSLHSIGHFILLGASLCAWKYEVKHDFLNNTSINELVEIPKKASLKILDGGAEIEQNGQRYDVVRTSENTYFCWLDTKENSILSSLLCTVIEKESKHNTNHFSILKDFFKYYIIDNQCFKYFCFSKTMILNIFNTFDLYPFYIASFLIPPMI